MQYLYSIKKESRKKSEVHIARKKENIIFGYQVSLIGFVVIGSDLIW